MEFSRKDLARIVGKASTITERLESNLLADEAQINDSIINSRLKRWCQLAAKGNPQTFEKRLAWDGLDLNAVRRVLGTVPLADNAPLPAWGETLAAVMEASAFISPETVEEGDSEQYPFLNPEEPIPFEAVFVPFVQVARQKLIVQASSSYQFLSSVAHTTLERNLLQQLSGIGSLALQGEFVTFRNFDKPTLAPSLTQSSDGLPRGQYKQFIQHLLRDGLLSFFEKYSVLARLLATATDFWIEAIAEFLHRLAQDWSEIQQTFPGETELGQVIKVKPELSDPHNRRRSVIAITFTSGLKLIYKPRNLGLEEAYFQFLAWLNERGIPLPFKILKVINHSTYGWVEYVEHLPCEDPEAAKRYYQRAGMLLCLLHALEGKDCHYENLIASGEHPVLVDLEMLLQPQVRNIEAEEDDAQGQAVAEDLLENSVLRISLLPRWEFAPDGKKIFDISGLGGFGEQETPFQVPKWHKINTDKMAFGYEYIKLPHKANLPFLNGVTLLPNDYVEEIIAGFRQLYQFLLHRTEAISAPDGPLAPLAHQELRFMFRITKIYTMVQKNTLTSKFLQNGADRSIELDILSRAFLLYDTKPYSWSVLRREQEALEQLDIPHFTGYSDSEALVISPDRTVEKCFQQPSYELVISRLERLSNEDLAQQIAIIRGSLYSLIAREPSSSSVPETGELAPDEVAPLTSEAIVEQAIAIATELKKRASLSADGSATWIGMEYIPQTGRFQLQLLGLGLEGCCGIAFFLAALEKVTGGAGFRDLAFSALQPLRQVLNSSEVQPITENLNLGAARGCGSMLYSLVRSSQFLAEPTLLEDAKRVTSLITPEGIANDRALDIVFGAAGAILGLLALHQVTADVKSLELAITCGQHLLKHRVVSATGYKAWKTIVGQKPLTGFSHGATGIAYALLRLYQVTSEAAFLEAAQEAIAYERSVFVPEAKNWPDFRPFVTADRQVSFMTSWCNGAPGIGLARLGSLAILDSPEIRQEIDIALQTTQEFGLQGVDHLCCGNFGRIDVLLEAASRLSRPELLEMAHKQAAWIVARAERTGSFNLFDNLPQSVYHPGFFLGTAGIGYELLRLAEPDLLPSVLLWE
ncbi:MAG: type 2 lanthipeptide synthetase LanM family protein [Xenococcaceae cyanobacterium]